MGTADFYDKTAALCDASLRCSSDHLIAVSERCEQRYEHLQRTGSSALMALGNRSRAFSGSDHGESAPRTDW
jgi:hypothetical protein